MEEIKKYLNDKFEVVNVEYNKNNWSYIYTLKCKKGHQFKRNKNLIKKYGYKNNCPICSNKILVVGYNDIATTHPNLLKYFVDKNLPYRCTIKSHNRTDFICPNCKNIQNMEIRKLKNGFKCNVCSDVGTYPEVLLKSILYYSNINFEFQKRFSWSENKIYDFYLKDYNYIIETHGGQHYNDSFKKVSGKSLKEEKSNDLFKKNIAINNGIDKYIVINCEKSEMEWIINSVRNSELINIINFDNINFDEVIYLYNKDLFEKIISIYNKENIGARRIAPIINMPRQKVEEILKIGDRLGLCSYKKEDIELIRKKYASKGVHNFHKKEIICLNDLKTYETYMECAKDKNVPRTTVSKCCNHKAHYTEDKNKNKWYWLFKNEYNSLTNEDIQKIMSFKQGHKNKKI